MRASRVRPKRLTWLAILALASSMAGAAAHAQSLDLHGRIELQDAGLFASQGDGLDAALGPKDRDDVLGNVRIIWEPSWNRWSLQIHYLVSAEYGPDVRLTRTETGLLPEPPANAVNLTGVIANQGQVLATQGIDRLAVAYTTPDTVIRVGRQALTWGSGLVFRPMDLFDPFSPTATDTEYKPGTDMVYVQRLFADGSDLQLIVAPRPARQGEAPTADASSIALHLTTNLFGHQTTWMLARDHGDLAGGIGVNGPLSGATWNLEFDPTVADHGQTRFSGLANISDAVTLFDRNATVFGEYFHNGFGVGGGRYDLEDLPADLLARLERGQLFNTRRDYLAGGLSLEVDPLLTLSPTMIVDLNDGSLFALIAGTYSLGDNLTLVAGAQAPIGPARSEFGGIPLSAGGHLVLAPPGQLYVQIRRYF